MCITQNYETSQKVKLVKCLNAKVCIYANFKIRLYKSLFVNQDTFDAIISYKLSNEKTSSEFS